MTCPSCQLMVIQGVICHERGCPDGHLFTTQECKWCGTEFRPVEKRRESFCCASCEAAYYVHPEPEFDESYALQS
jgi:hypothetical protein